MIPHKCSRNYSGCHDYIIRIKKVCAQDVQNCEQGIERNVQIISFIIIFISCRIYIKNILVAIKLDYLLITSRRQASKNMTNESNFKKHLPERLLNVNESRKHFSITRTF